MMFTTPEFFIFLVVVILLIELIRSHLWQQIILIVASYFFYWWSGSIHVLLLAFVTIASYLIGRQLQKANDAGIAAGERTVKEVLDRKGRTEIQTTWSGKAKRNRKIWLVIGTVIPLGVLAYFKYIDFGITQINNITALFGAPAIPLLNVALPIGISFFTFQALSYVFDIYLGKIEHEKKFHRYILFIAFFPALVAGPIVRASEFLPQLKNKIKITAPNLQAGLTLIAWGLFKKMVIADNVAYYVNTVFDNPSGYSSLYIVGATILFGIQIYCDFSGYAHIAIGIARIFGFKLPENFNLPYIAHNFQDFWRRWHMTLSRFIRDYVYIPLGGNRKGHGRTYVNLIVAMLLCGLWHGAAWTFIIWGAYHGILQAIERFIVTDKKIGTKSKFLASNPALFGKILVTQIFVFFGWMIFRVNSLDDLVICCQKLFSFDILSTSGSMRTALLGCVAAGILGMVLFFVLLFNKKFANGVKKIVTYNYLGLISNVKLRYWLIFIIVMVAAVLLLSPSETPEFIYFAF